MPRRRPSSSIPRQKRRHVALRRPRDERHASRRPSQTHRLSDFLLLRGSDTHLPAFAFPLNVSHDIVLVQSVVHDDKRVLRLPVEAIAKRAVVPIIAGSPPRIRERCLPLALFVALAVDQIG